MTDIAWFFSTLSQSTAAIVSFIVAFSAVFYQLERRKANEQTEKARDELVELREKYEDIINLISSNFAEQLDDETDIYYLTEMDIGPEELRERVENDDEIEMPITALVWGLLFRVFVYLRKIEPSKQAHTHNLLSQKELNGLLDCVGALEVYTDLRTAKSFVGAGWLETTIMDGLVQESIGEPEAKFDHQIVEKDHDMIMEWIQKNTDHSESSTRPNGPRQNDGDFDLLNSLFTNLYDDVLFIEKLYANSILRERRSFIEDMKYIIALVISGVFAPMVPLLSIPSNVDVAYLSGWYLFFFQLLLLVITSFLSLFLIYRLVDRMSG